MSQPLGKPAHIGNLDASQLGPQPTYLPDDHPDVEARRRLDAGEEPTDVAHDLPASCLAWAELSDEAFSEGRLVDSYAYARVGSTVASTLCVRLVGAVSVRFRTPTRSTAASSTLCTTWAGLPPASAKQRRPSGLRSSSATPIRRPLTASALEADEAPLALACA